VDSWKEAKQEADFKVGLLPHLLEKIFCSPTTSAPAERVFSSSVLFMRRLRAGIGDKLSSDLVFLEFNKHV